MKKATFEENMTRLEEIVSLLEQGDAPLSESLALFSEGSKLLAACRKELDTAQQKVTVLMGELQPDEGDEVDTRLS